MVSSLLGRCGVHSMEQVLAARMAAVGPMTASVDGGAGWGATARALAEVTTPDGRVHAFEPFPGNHRFFADLDARIRLDRRAISDRQGKTSFFVPSTVEAEDAWGESGFGGYSSLGQLTTRRDGWTRTVRANIERLWGRKRRSQLLEVETTRLDAAVPERHLDFVKLDLQGGELSAIVGMGSLLAATDLLWIEYSGQAGLLDHLLRKGLILFDTNYLCPRLPRERLEEFDLAACREIVLSTNQPALLATRTRDTVDYPRWFAAARRARVVMQTDLLAVNPAFLGGLAAILGALAPATGPAA